jgi:hypothetical protein
MRVQRAQVDSETLTAHELATAGRIEDNVSFRVGELKHAAALTKPTGNGRAD